MNAQLHAATLTGRFPDAVRYAADIHAKQKRKGTQIPYLSHLLAVASLVLEAGGDEDEAISAILHDAAEDQGGRERLNDIRRRFGDRVARIVEACSDALDEDPADKAPWLERKSAYQRHLRAEADPSVHLVSAADKLHNTEAMLADHRVVGPALWSRFSAGGGRDLIIWNLRELVDAYRHGPPDERRETIVRRLSEAIDRLEAESSIGRMNVGPPSGD